MSNLKTQISQLKTQNGFTLMELLVGMAIGIMIIEVLFLIFPVSRKTYKTGIAKTEAAQNARIGLDKLARELRETPEIVTSLPPDELSEPTHEIMFQDPNFTQIRYLTYYLSDTDLKRETTHYYLVGAPDDWVYYDTPEAIEQIDEDSIIVQYITNLDMWGESLINISFDAQTDSQTVNLKTAVWARNI